MTARVDTQAAKERAERTLNPPPPTVLFMVNHQDLAKAHARDVLALLGLLADAEKENELLRAVAKAADRAVNARREFDATTDDESEADYSYYRWQDAVDDLRAALAAGRGERG